MGRYRSYGFALLTLFMASAAFASKELEAQAVMPPFMRKARWALAFLTLVMLALTVRLFMVARVSPMEPPPPPEPEAAAEGAITRRSFLSLLGWAWLAFTAATLGALTTVLRFFFPNVIFEPPPVFVVGMPNTYSIGVNNDFKSKFSVWVVRAEEGFYCLSTVCTHLGCTPNWLESEQKFKCPCHGSGYYISGVNFEGPAPRPLERYQVAWAEDGQIQVDKSVVFRQELGQWNLPGAFLPWRG